MKQLLTIFLVSFFTNFVWENLHSVLYVGYQGGKITEFILLHAALGDAIIIVLMSLPFVYFKHWKQYSWIIIPIGLVLATCIEWYALSVGRWTYSNAMLIVPILHIGFTPFVQLGILGYFSFLLSHEK